MKIRQVNKKKKKENGMEYVLNFLKISRFKLNVNVTLKNMKIKPDTGLNSVDYRQIVFIRNQVTFQR